MDGNGNDLLEAEAPGKLLILDVNGFLLHRVYRMDPALLARIPDVRIGEFSVFMRPSSKAFCRWCLEHFTLVTWGTAMRSNLLPLVSLLFEGTRGPAAVLSQEDCVDSGLRHPSKPGKRLLLKPLGVVWASVASLGAFDTSNTLMLDDAPYKTCLNPLLTSLHPVTWDPERSTPELENALSENAEIQQLLTLYGQAEDGRTVVQLQEDDVRVRGSAIWQTNRNDALVKLVSGTVGDIAQKNSEVAAEVAPSVPGQ